MSVIRFNDVWEMFRIRFSGEGRPYWKNYWALRGITFSVSEGEVLGIMGENGSGKTTILKLIGGIIRPDRGSVEVKGKAAGLLELGAGFQPELTGRENVLICSGMHGYSGEAAERKLKEVDDFARIGDFINAPVKNYSQGMFVRLAFSFAVSLEPDILLIDDSLAVGDGDFQKSCIDKIISLKESGRTIIFVTHDTGLLNKIATRALLLKNGRLLEDSQPERVGALYALVCGSPEGKAALESGRLRMVFNNGILFFSWDGRQVTSEKGVSAYLLCAGEWLFSHSGQWRITGGGGNRIEAEGIFSDKGVSLKWIIELAENGGVQWDIYAYSEDGAPLVSDCRMEFCFDRAYNEWFTNVSRGGLGAVSSVQAREASSAWIRYAAVKPEEREEDRGAGLPEVVVEPRRDNEDSDGVEVLDGEDNFGRMMLRSAHPPLSSAPKWRSAAAYFSGRIFFRRQSVPVQAAADDNEKELVSGDSRFLFHNGELLMISAGVPLTCSRHIYAEIYGDRQIYDSREAGWKVRKTGPDRIVACGFWPGAAFRQLWEILLASDGTLRIKIWLVCRAVSLFRRRRLQAMCLSSYSSYFSCFGSGEFPARFCTEEYDVLQRCLPCGDLGVLDASGKLPTLALSFEEEENNFAKIMNSDLFNRSRILSVEKVEPEEKLLFPPGRHHCFSVSIRAFPPGTDLSAGAELRSGKAGLLFSGGRFALIHEGKTLSGDLGLYVSFRSGGRWHDSVSKTVWKLDSCKEGELTCSAQWRQLPIKQTWRIYAKGKGRFAIQVVLLVTGDTILERQQFNLALREVYSRWSHRSRGGVFGMFPRDTGDDWQTVETVPAGAQPLSASCTKNGLPEVKLAVDEIREGWKLEAVNSDLCYRSRVLRLSNAGETALSPGESVFFSGMLTIE